MEGAEVVESVQRGVCSGMYHRGRYSPGANVTHHSHKIPRPVSERVTRFCQAAQRLLRNHGVAAFDWARQLGPFNRHVAEVYRYVRAHHGSGLSQT